MKKLTILISIITVCFAAQNVIAHCEIPCGIYDDGMRIKLIREHIATIEKSMIMIAELDNGAEKNTNQIVRWITNKEYHANELQAIVAQYFMTQRIKPIVTYDDIHNRKELKKLTLLHSLLVAAMKSKQSIELKHIKTMRDIVDSFENIYFESK